MFKLNLKEFLPNAKKKDVNKLSKFKATEELNKSDLKQVHIDRLLSTSPTIIYSRSIHNNFPVTFISDNIEMNFGYKSSAFLKKSNFWMDQVHPEDRARLSKELAVVLKESYNAFEYRFKDSSGEYKWIHDRARLIYNKDDEPIEIVGSYIDITHRIKIEERLRQTNIFLDSIIENIPDMIFLKDAKDLKFKRFNKAGEDLLGFKREELLEKNDYDFFPVDEANQFTQKDRAVLKNKKLHTINEEPIHTKKKGTRYLHTKKIPILDSNGNPEYLLGISEDITEKKLIKERLQETQHIHKQVLNAMQDMVLVKGIDQKPIWGNKAFYRFTGLSTKSLKTAQNLTDKLDPFDKNDAEVFKSGKVIHIPEEIFTDVYGKEYYFTTINTPIFNISGSIAMVISTYKDITKQKKSKQKERELQIQLLQREKLASIGLLTAGMAHELNNPLTGLRSLICSIPEIQKTAPENCHHIANMIEAADHMGKIISDLEEFSNDASNCIDKLNINTLIESTLNFTQYQIVSKNINVSKSLDPNLPLITGNKSEIQQVILNLLTNAKDAISDTGALGIETSFDSERNVVLITFTDTGEGIQSDDLIRVFDPFFSTKLIGNGVGLGLSVVHGIIKKHNGNIYIKSEPEEGCVIRVELPAN
ncbi:MAG: two-component system NtrC family sensor kinase [Lysobacterales bacterium]|jgi:two-component system NtrC family sensor kinase